MSKQKESEGLKLISPVRGKNIESERNNNFSPEAAIAEIIDNSLEANAKTIKIRIKWGKVSTSQRKERPTVIAIGDDGDGMDGDGRNSTLQNCLVLGESTRYNSRAGFGRFGVGMTKGAISLCRQVEVYSRQKQGTWKYIKLDLDVLDVNRDPGITPVAAVEKLPKEFSDLVGDYGTLVIWSKIDRIESDFSVDDVEAKGRLRPGLKHWLERTFRKKIGKQIIKNGEIVENENSVTIELDDSQQNRELIAFDPLYFISDPRKPNDGTSTLSFDKEILYEVSNIDKPNESVSEGKITIRMTLTPEAWRQERKHGNSPESRSRYLPDNEGFSILRDGREVFFGKIDFWEPKLDLFDRWWSCEIDFNPVLDYQFKVANVKIGAKPIIELREKLQEKISSTVTEDFRKKIQGLWSKNEANSTNVRPQPEIPPDVIKPVAPQPITPQEEEEHRGEDGFEELREKLKDPDCPPIVLQPRRDMDPGDPIIEPSTVAGRPVAFINLQHFWWQRLFGRIDTIKELSKNDGNSDKIIEEVDHLKEDIDRLIISMTKAIKDMKDDEISSMEEVFETFLFRLSLTLRNLIKKSMSDD